MPILVIVKGRKLLFDRGGKLRLEESLDLAVRKRFRILEGLKGLFQVLQVHDILKTERAINSHGIDASPLKNGLQPLSPRFQR